MKLYQLGIIIFILSLLSTTTYAATVSGTPEPTISKDERFIDEINNLREKVASKVAELNLVEKRGILMVTQDVSGNKITGNDLQNKTRLVDVDELTKFSSPSAKSTFGISDITKGSQISVVGLYNKQSKRILARFIESVSPATFLSGHITQVDKVNFTITILSENKQTTLIDIENITKTSSYLKEDGSTRLGFSKLAADDRVIVVGYPNVKEKNRITASRIVVFPELPNNPKIISTDTASSDFAEQSASGSSTIAPTVAE